MKTFLIVMLLLSVLFLYTGIIVLIENYLNKKKEKHRKEKSKILYRQLKSGIITDDEYDREMEFLDFN